MVSWVHYQIISEQLIKEALTNKTFNFFVIVASGGEANKQKVNFF